MTTKEKIEQWKPILQVGNEVEVLAAGRKFVGEVTEVGVRWLMIDTWNHEENGRDRKLWWTEIQEINEIKEEEQ